jgi:hypothetical protein
MARWTPPADSQEAKRAIDASKIDQVGQNQPPQSFGQKAVNALPGIGSAIGGAMSLPAYPLAPGVAPEMTALGMGGGNFIGSTIKNILGPLFGEDTGYGDPSKYVQTLTNELGKAGEMGTAGEFGGALTQSLTPFIASAADKFSRGNISKYMNNLINTILSKTPPVDADTLINKVGQLPTGDYDTRAAAEAQKIKMQNDILEHMNPGTGKAAAQTASAQISGRQPQSAGGEEPTVPWDYLRNERTQMGHTYKEIPTAAKEIVNKGGRDLYSQIMHQEAPGTKVPDWVINQIMTGEENKLAPYLGKTLARTAVAGPAYALIRLLMSGKL